MKKEIQKIPDLQGTAKKTLKEAKKFIGRRVRHMAPGDCGPEGEIVGYGPTSCYGCWLVHWDHTGCHNGLGVEVLIGPGTEKFNRDSRHQWRRGYEIALVKPQLVQKMLF